MRGAGRREGPFRLGLLPVQFQLHCVYSHTYFLSFRLPVSFLALPNRFWRGSPLTQFLLITLFPWGSYLSPTLIFKHLFGSWPICSLGLAILRDVDRQPGLEAPWVPASVNVTIKINKQAMLCSWRIYHFAHHMKCIPFYFHSVITTNLLVGGNRSQSSQCFSCLPISPEASYF